MKLRLSRPAWSVETEQRRIFKKPARSAVAHPPPVRPVDCANELFRCRSQPPKAAGYLARLRSEWDALDEYMAGELLGEGEST